MINNMGRKLDMLDTFLTVWQSENNRIATEHETTEFFMGTMFAIDRIKLQIQKLKEDDDDDDDYLYNQDDEY
jgi:transcriptional regulatory protein LevR